MVLHTTFKFSFDSFDSLWVFGAFFELAVLELEVVVGVLELGDFSWLIFKLGLEFEVERVFTLVSGGGLVRTVVFVVGLAVGLAGCFETLAGVETLN